MNKKIVSVYNFLTYQDIRPLIFYKFNGELENLDLDEIVLECISLTEDYRSQNSITKGIETYSGKWRSAIDIWRHVKFFKKDTNIFQALSSIYKIRGKLAGHYCPHIRRRVFKLSSNNPQWGLGDLNYIDEFGLRFSDWRTLEFLYEKEENET